MIPLSVPIDDMDFDALVEIARSRLPPLAPEWTDYNYSDPGITVVELLAWIADSQIYSIGRNRTDERIAMAGLLGIHAKGAVPAAGTVFATERVVAPRTIAAGTRLTPIGACAPRLEVAHEVALRPLEIVAIVVETPTASRDLTAANAEPRTTFAPFGEPPSDEAVLRVVLKGELDAGEVSISLGFELENDADESDEGLGGIAVGYTARDGTESAATIGPDTTGGLRRSGVMILKLVVPNVSGDEHTLRFGTTEDALMPRLLRITPNALPVVQRATLRPPPFTGTGRPGQRIFVEPLAHFPPDEAAEDRVWRLTEEEDALVVQVEEEAELRKWKPGRFRDAATGDDVYERVEQPDGGGVAIRFGNGVNGRRPPVGTQILVAMKVSGGEAGNIAAVMDWRLDGAGTRWRNREPITGGRDAHAVDDLLARLRRTLRSDRTLATASQIEEAARGLSKAFGIKRVAVVEGWEPGRRRPASPATRTLLVTREGNSNETADWLRAIRRNLRARISLAERLIVASPRWRDLRVRVRAVAAPGRRPETVAADIRALLADRLSPDGKHGAKWPMGQDVTAMTVGGWIRRLPDVATVGEVVLLDQRGQAIADGRLALGRGELPRLTQEADDVGVGTGGAR